MKHLLWKLILNSLSEFLTNNLFRMEIEKKLFWEIKFGKFYISCSWEKFDMNLSMTHSGLQMLFIFFYKITIQDIYWNSKCELSFVGKIYECGNRDSLCTSLNVQSYLWLNL